MRLSNFHSRRASALLDQAGLSGRGVPGGVWGAVGLWGSCAVGRAGQAGGSLSATSPPRPAQVPPENFTGVDADSEIGSGGELAERLHLAGSHAD